MLPAAARLRHREDFNAVFRRGRRAARGPLVVHLLAASDAAPGTSPRVGFVVGRPVGSAVARNLIRRRLRHLLRDRLAALPPGSRLVVRVLPDAARLGYAELGATLDAALGRVGVA